MKRVACLIIVFGIGFGAGLSRADSSAVAQSPKPAALEATNPKLKHLCIERYQFLKRLSPRIGTFPLWYSMVSDCRVLFPVGRADRVYIVVRGASYWSVKVGGENVVIRYDHRDGRDRKVYTARFSEGKEQTSTHTSSILDIMRLNGFALSERRPLSQYVRQDLSASRDYVEYKYLPYTDTLSVWKTSELVYGRLSYDLGLASVYDLGEDPVTHGKLREGTVDKKGVETTTVGEQEFFHKYGMPPGRGEDGEE